MKQEQPDRMTIEAGEQSRADYDDHDQGRN